MFRTYQMLWNRLFQTFDALIVLASFLIAWFVKFHTGWLPYGGHFPLRYYIPAMILAVPIFLVSNWMTGLYRTMRSLSFIKATSAIFRSTAIGLLMFMSSLYVTKLGQFPRSVLVLFSIAFVLLTYLERLGIRALLRMARTWGFNKKFVVVVGWTPAIQQLIESLEQQPWFGYHILGYVADEGNQPSEPGVPCVGMVSELEHVLRNNLVDHVLISLGRLDSPFMAKVIGVCEMVGVQSLIVPDYVDVLPANPRLETFAGMPVIDTRYVPLDDAVNAALKRLLDIVFSLLILVVLSPIILTLTILVKLTSRGPVFYAQQRVGKNRRLFMMYKFRTMRYTASEFPRVGWTVRDDPRRTRIGRFLRRMSLDELPQFWNVLLGDMSIIGPRPEQPQFVDTFMESVPKYMVKHRVRPGITGWAQVHGWRGDTSIHQRIRYDIDYIENWSFGMDVKIVIRTCLEGFRHENAY